MDGPGKVKQNIYRSDGLKNMEGEIRMGSFILHSSLTKGHESRRTRRKKKRERGVEEEEGDEK
jgi:hypothetical protein